MKSASLIAFTVLAGSLQCACGPSVQPGSHESAGRVSGSQAQGTGATTTEPSLKLTSVTILVKDYDQAAQWYSETLGLQVEDNRDLSPGRRWVTMSFNQDPTFRIVLHKPGNGYMDLDKELSPDRVGKETYWIVQTSDFDVLFKRLAARGVRFRSDVHTERWAKEVVFEDLYGNLWVLQQGTDANRLSGAKRLHGRING
jgi:catechol 2,3-dioxygenase-like lactoylglutathione lyase family enzyme